MVVAAWRLLQMVQKGFELSGRQRLSDGGAVAAQFFSDIGHVG
jgi:hypothetical protein